MAQFGFLKETAGSYDHGTDALGGNSEPVSIANTASTKSSTGLGIPTHRYPLFVDNVSDTNKGIEVVQECIHFTAIKQGGISLQKQKTNEDAKKAMEDQLENASSKYTKEQAAKDKASRAKMDYAIASNDQKKMMDAKRTAEPSEPDPTVGEIYGGGVVDTLKSFGKGQLKAIRTKAKNLEHCFIYMPNSVQFAEGAQWGSQSLGGVGNAIKSGLRGEGNIDSIMKNFTGGVVTEAAKGAALAGGAAAAGVLGALGTAAMFDGIGSGLRAAGRFTQNPYEEQLFNGVGFREFTFEFQFAPASAPEGQEVDNIIKMFRKNSRPSFVGGFLGEGLYTFPNEFAIDFKMNKGGALVENTFLPRIHNCVCTNVVTNYSPEGFWVALRDGRPVSYVLGLSFTETVKITQSNETDGHGGVEEGY